MSKCRVNSAHCDDCLCDLRALVGRFDDWQIARLTGAATYAQLLDAGPGIFKAFPDYRSDGNSCSAITSFNGTAPREESNGTISIEAGVPPPPNLVSTILVDGAITPAGIKRELIRAVCGQQYDPIVEPLIRTSLAYRNPEMALGDLIGLLIVMSIAISIFLAVAVVYFRRPASLL